MIWQKISELRYGVDETRPGFEDCRKEKRYRGEEIEVAIDPDWPAFPRLELRESGIVAGTIECVLDSGVKLEVIDKTGDEEIGMPPLDIAFLSAYNGPDFDTAYLYFNVSRAGETVYLDYEYYPEDDSWAYLALKDTEILAASRTGRFYRLGDTIGRLYDIPGEPNSLSEDGARSGGRSLFHFGREHRPAVRNISRDESPRALAASVAVAFGADLRYTPDRTLSLSDRRETETITVPTEWVLTVEATNFTVYEAIRAVFDGGAVAAGSGREIQVNLPTVCDVGVARSVAERLISKASGITAKYIISLSGDYDIMIGDILAVTGMFRGTVTKIKRYLNQEKTDIELSISKPGGVTSEQSK